MNPGWDDAKSRADKDPACRPRKGTFEIRVDGKAVLSLVGMPRPFKKLRATDMEEFAATL